MSLPDTKPSSTPVDSYPAEDDDINNEELTPPPDSPIDETMSQSSSPIVNALEDEIVVGTKSNNSNSHNNLKSSPIRVTSDQEDVDMDDVETHSTVAQYPKRKRTSVYQDLAEDDEPEASEARIDQDIRPRPPRPTKTHGTGGVKGVILGHWRDSEPLEPINKHAVIGFIDVRDRLRTRIQPHTRDGRSLTEDFPLPPGPGGSWVTFEKVAFDSHLVNLNHHMIKEYVKIRADTSRKDETLEEKERLNAEALAEARRRLELNPPPESGVQPAIAYGIDIPAQAYFPNRPETKKRRMMGSFGGQAADSPSAAPSPVASRTVRILLGYWKKSDQEEEADKHAVYGILGQNDMFRVKLVRETRDGRPMIGNFPQGAGALWINWDDVRFEEHLQGLPRPEIKEYCRIRQRQIDEGESVDTRKANEALAVAEALNVVRNASTNTYVSKKEERGSIPPALAMKGSPLANGDNGYDDGPDIGRRSMSSLGRNGDANGSLSEYRQSRRSDTGMRGRHSLPDVELRPANRNPPAASSSSAAALERTHTIARREVTRLEAVQMRADQHAASREVSGPSSSSYSSHQHQNHNQYHHAPLSNRSQFNESVQRLNKVWAAQEANRLKGGGDDAKMYMGVKYERKQNGPFEGKLVSQGSIISIDGEDYVEYRVLTKPTFF
ncbi:hypothetical protein B0T24DRAFT_316560 [Lasiosphaeria ovina]|uniref:Uncharacterized protein n=1 Tax=Lasiosphaeria ovina TaxID=92902 RepID=A0AAE0K877_9PEZI|nr:hypothetical protein B0T24DRAFT_316560 [Lasiosphaeria ovina]